MKLALVAALALALPQSRASRHSIEVTRRDGEAFCTIKADNAPIHAVLVELADRAGLSLDGFDTAWNRTLVSADLRDRPLRQALDYLMGSVGIEADVRQGAIFLRAGLEGSADAGALHDAALAEYLGALREFPDHALAPEAERSQAWIEERRGRRAAARAHYEQLFERYPDSELVHEARFRAGELLMLDGAWQDAANRLSELLRSDRPHDYEARARLELAWCVAQLGQFERALYMIDALDAIEAASSRADELRRKQVRVRCLAGLGEGRKALALLDELDSRLVTSADKRDSLELRAIACSADGRRADAARAWLAYAQLVDGPLKERALRESATLALAEGDELGALFVAQAARAAGIELGGIEREARTGLGLDDPRLARTAPIERLERAERLVASGMTKEAVATLRALQPQLAGLDEATRTRLALALGRALCAEYGIEIALAHFRQELENLRDPELRRGIYVLAGELLEDAGRIDEAIEAYQGRI